MDLHLHHAQIHTLNAAQQMSSAAWAAKLSTGSDMVGDYVINAREYLAKAEAELNAYDAKRTYKPEAA